MYIAHCHLYKCSGFVSALCVLLIKESSQDYAVVMWFTFGFSVSALKHNRHHQTEKGESQV